MKKYQNYLSEIFRFLAVKFSVYLNRHVFLMVWNTNTQPSAVQLNICQDERNIVIQ